MEDDTAGGPATDPLTGAYSRGLLVPRLTEELARAARSSTGFAVFVFDVDYFKSVNDAYGHARGDQVLVDLVARIGGLVRGYDTLFRYGGDEFVLLLPETARPDAVQVALRLVEGVRGAEFAGDPPLRVSVSLGVAVFPEDGTDVTGLLGCADRRNYLAKHRGRACAVADDAESERPAGSSRLLERDTQLAAVHEFLTRLTAEPLGALRVVGEPGAGHTRFLDMAARAAQLRGFRVLDASAPIPPGLDPGDPGTAGSGPGDAVPAGLGSGLLVLVDRPDEAAGGELPDTVRQAIAGAAGGPVGVIYAAVDAAAGPPDGLDLPVLDSVELLAWSAAAVRIWLRTTLPGEPSPALVNWLAGRGGGLPARVERELNRLRSRGGLARHGSNAWTVAAEVLARSSRPRRRLPVPLTELVGRQQETAQVAGLLAGGRLVTLVGAGGIGKTRLSLAVGAAVAERFDDGVVFVPLAEAGTRALVVAALADALDLAELPGQPLVDTVSEQLAEQATLLVLDNFEQVRSAAPLVSELLAAAPGVSVLVSSRERLGLYGEQVYAVPPLRLPDAATPARGPGGVAAALATSPALALFHARARAAAYDFTLTPDNLDSVIELCRRLDGLPLAIELAAAHTDGLSPADILGQLRGRLDLPGDGPRDLPARQRTLRGTIDWSFALLDPADRDLFMRLGVFTGGCRVGAARAVTGVGGTDPELARRLRRLADRSLLQVEPPDGDDARYTMLHTIRSYALDQLTSGGQAEPARRRHADHYAAVAEQAERDLTGPDQARCAGRVVLEYQNLRGAFGWALDNADAGTAARIGLGLWRFWRAGSHLGEGREWLDRLLASADPLPDRVRARVLHAAAVLAGAQDEHETATALASESWLLARSAGDDPTAAQARNALGIAALAAGDYPAAGGYFADSLTIWSGLDAPLGMAIAHGNLAKVAMRNGDIDAASRHATRCLELDQRYGNTRGVMLGLLCLGEILLIRGDTAGARTRLTEAMALSRTLGDVFGQAMALHQLGETARRDGDPAGARRLVAAALELRRDIGDREDLAISLETLAGLLAAEHPAATARLLAATDALRRRYRLPLPAADPVREAALTRLRSALAADILAATCVTAPLADLDTLVDDVVELANHPETRRTPPA